MAGLPHKVKLAINTKTYQDDEGDDFTVSMSVSDKDDFTGLVDNIPILHRGKRYFVDLHLHNANPRDEMCSLPWMKNAKICVNNRRRRSVSSNMSVGFGPVVLPDDQELANERPSAEALLDVLGNHTNIFADEEAEEVEAEIAREEIEIVEMEINRETYRKRRKVLIISAMGAGCFLLFILSVLISSRASCICKKSSDRKKASRKISTNVLASQIQRELAHASNI